MEMFIGLCSVALTAIAWSSVKILIWCWGMSFLVRIETPPEAVPIFVYVTVLFVVSDIELVGVFEECFL